ncbi:hypothetical protein OWM07_03225 [Deferribacter thermophilus]|uniref:hypothetical protein n=1 Tax=Deferribacter thermophilus TaxID=53573 RepID=UPI003C24F536
MYEHKKYAAKGNIYKITIGIVLAIQLTIYFAQKNINGFKLPIYFIFKKFLFYNLLVYNYVLQFVYNVLVDKYKLTFLSSIFAKDYDFATQLITIYQNNYQNLKYFLLTKHLVLFYLKLFVIIILIVVIAKLLINIIKKAKEKQKYEVDYAEEIKNIDDFIEYINDYAKIKDLLRLKANFYNYVNNWGTDTILFINNKEKFENSNIYFMYLFETFKKHKNINYLAFQELLKYVKNKDFVQVIKETPEQSKSVKYRKIFDTYRKIKTGEFLYE